MQHRRAIHSLLFIYYSQAYHSVIYKSMSLKYEPASELLHISEKWLIRQKVNDGFESLNRDGGNLPEGMTTISSSSLLLSIQALEGPCA